MEINNYYTSSTGVSIEFSFYRSTSEARLYLEALESMETFVKISDRLYAWDFDYKNPRQAIDLDKMTEEDAREVVDALNNYWRLNPRYLEECKEVCNGDYKEILVALCNELYESPLEFVGGVADYIAVELPVTFDTLTVRGDYEGDWADVLYRPSVVEADFGSVETFAEHVRNVLFDCPVEGGIRIRTVQEEIELFCSDLELPHYEWDAERTAEAIFRNIRNRLPIEQAQIVRDFLKENLPETLEYI